MTLNLDTITLSKGAHPLEDAVCVMEATALLAGETKSDHPQCASPVVSAFLRSWNDTLDDETRQQLKRHIPALIGSRGTKEQEEARSWMACDWLVRTFTPAWLRLAGLDADADALEALPALTSKGLADAALPVIERARKASAAAWAAAGAAAGAALKQTTSELQQSALDLVRRMIAVGSVV